MGTSWDAHTYDVSSEPQQAWASDVLARLQNIALARDRLGDRAEVLCQDVLDRDIADPVDVIVSTAALHWVPDHES